MHSFDHEETPAFKEPLAGGFSGAYLTSEPEITVVRLQPSDKWLVLGTDGLWDNLPIEQSVAVIQNLYKERKQKNERILQARQEAKVEDDLWKPRSVTGKQLVKE